MDHDMDPQNTEALLEVVDYWSRGHATFCTNEQGAGPKIAKGAQNRKMIILEY